MPFLPKLYEEEKQTENISNFAGYNHNEKIANNEFYDCKNISLEKYPLLSPRAKRHTSGITLNGGETIVAMSEYDGEVVYVTKKEIENYKIKYRNSSNRNKLGYYFYLDNNHNLVQTNGNPAFNDDFYISAPTSIKVWYFVEETGTYYLASDDCYEYDTNNKILHLTKNPITGDDSGTYPSVYDVKGGFMLTETLNNYIAYTLYAGGNTYKLNDWQTDLQLENRETFYSKDEKDWWLEKYKYDETPNISIVKTGAFIYVYPFGKYINMALPVNDRGIMLTAQDKPLEYRIKIEPCDVNGEEYKIDYINSVVPGGTIGDGKYWYDTKNHVIKQYSSYTATWNTVTSNYIKISYDEETSDGTNFANINLYDRILVTSLNKLGWRKFYKNYHTSPEELTTTEKQTFIEGFYSVPYGDPAIDKPREAIVYKIDEEAYQYIVVKGLAPFGIYVQYHMWSNDTLTSEPLRIIKEMPKMDFAMSCNNRIWGCYYGEGADGKVINEIYASGLGDPGRWYSYPGMASDSFTQSVGTEGKWTGCVNYLGSPIFFKENGLYRIYGSNPSQYQLVSNENCRGCESGSERSVAILNEVLFYKSRDGICTYTGSLPVCISDKLGVSKYKEAIAAADNNKYYVSMSDGADRSLFVYDIRLGMWVKEDNVNIQSIQRVKNDICAFDGTNLIWLSNLDSHSDSTEEEDFEWNFVTGRMYTDYLNKKYIDKLSVRCNIRFGATLSFFIEYDSNGTYIPVGTVTGRNLGVITLPIKIKRCDHLRLKVSGKGYTEIYSIEQEFVFGGKG